MTAERDIDAQRNAFLEALLAIDRLEVRHLLEELVTMMSPLIMVEQLIVPALEVIGERWEQGDVSLAQVYMSGRICEEMVDTLLPSANVQQQRQPAIAIAVLEDYHMLGKRMVYATLRSGGFVVSDYGRIDTDNLVARVVRERVAILLISVLMLPSALQIKAVRQKLNAAGWRPKIIVGGAPFRFDRQLWQEVGADAMGSTASDSVALVTSLLEASA
ncbi:MAG: cobalamin-binding protein [Chloroflexia bacterium]|nr:cobalamin-binding protein [Chloroflexia bacterium]